MTAENALPSQVTHASGFQETPVSAPPEISAIQAAWQPDIPTVVDGAIENEFVIDPLSFQGRVKSGFVERILGEQFTLGLAVEEFKRRADMFTSFANGLSQEALSSPSSWQRQVLENRGARLTIATNALASRLVINLEAFVDKKLNEKMYVKYNPNDVTEIRLYGTEDDPGPKTGYEALKILKATFDEPSGVQTYVNRGLPVNKREEKARLQVNRFTDPYQDLAEWWQRRGQGSSLVVADRLKNLKDPQDGEIVEAVNALALIPTERLSLSHGFIDPDILREVGRELADVVIGKDCYFAAIKSDMQPIQERELTQTETKYADLPLLLAMGVPFKDGTAFLHAHGSSSSTREFPVYEATS